MIKVFITNECDIFLALLIKHRHFINQLLEINDFVHFFVFSDVDMVYQCHINNCAFVSHISMGFRQHQTRFEHFMCSTCKTQFLKKNVFVEHLRSAHSAQSNISWTEIELIDKNNKDFRRLPEEMDE